VGPAIADTERRGTDRRRRRRFVVRERRSGFDRRGPSSSVVGAAFDRMLRAMADNDRILLLVLAHLAVLNVLDLVFTRRALGLGAVEANPIMAVLFASGPVVAALMKLEMVVIGGFVLWKLRRYRRALEFATFATAGYAVLFGYHLFLVARFG